MPLAVLVDESPQGLQDVNVILVVLDVELPNDVDAAG
jgi:hypothetical protein